MTSHSDTPRNCPAHFGMHEIPCPIGCKDICARAQPLEMNKLVSALTAQLAEARIRGMLRAASLMREQATKFSLQDGGSSLSANYAVAAALITDAAIQESKK